MEHRRIYLSGPVTGQPEAYGRFEAAMSNHWDKIQVPKPKMLPLPMSALVDEKGHYLRTCDQCRDFCTPMCPDAKNAKAHPSRLVRLDCFKRSRTYVGGRADGRR